MLRAAFLDRGLASFLLDVLESMGRGSNSDRLVMLGPKLVKIGDE